MKEITIRLLSVVLALTMVVTLMPSLSMTVMAAACQTCNGTGIINEDCPACGATGKEGICIVCMGSGGEMCSWCGGSGCWSCGFTGKINCSACGGSGGSICLSCYGSGKKERDCTHCNGTGAVSDHDHDFASTWSYDDIYHWHSCNGQGAADTCKNETGAAKATHSYGYSAQDNVLTAACACGKSVALTLTASSINPFGSSATITIGTADEKEVWATAGLTVPTAISYEKADGTPLEETPTTEGNYVAKVSPVGENATAANTAKVNFKIKAPATNRYILTIPSETTVESYGYTELAGELNVSSGDLASDKCVVVKAEKDDFKCAANGGNIGYTLKCNGTDYDSTNGIKWTASDAKDDGKPVKIGIDIDEDDYLDAPDGEYTGSIKWTAKLTKESSRYSIKKSLMYVDGMNEEDARLINEEYAKYDVSIDDEGNITVTGPDMEESGIYPCLAYTGDINIGNSIDMVDLIALYEEHSEDCTMIIGEKINYSSKSPYTFTLDHTDEVTNVVVIFSFGG